MSYVPINVQAYTAAYSGAVAGMAVNGWITSPTGANYTLVCAVAGAFAEAFDIAWNAATALNGLEYSAIQSVCAQEFSQRGPGPLAATQFQDPANWAVSAKACATLALQCDLYFAGQGITPPAASPPPAKFLLTEASPPNPVIPGGSQASGIIIVPHTLEADEVLELEAYTLVTTGSSPSPATSYWNLTLLLEVSSDGGVVFNPVTAINYYITTSGPPDLLNDAPPNFPVSLRFQVTPFDPAPTDLRFRLRVDSNAASNDSLSFSGGHGVEFTLTQGKKLIP
jgi:hypothetical protein